MNAFVCRTPVQLLRAIQVHLRMEEFMDSSDLYLDGVCSNLEYKYRIDNLKRFRNVYVVPQNRNKCQTARLMYGKNEIAKVLRKKTYDKLISFNIEGITAQAIYNLNKNNNKFEYHCMEDAPSISPLYTPSRYNWRSYQYWLRIEKECFHITTWWASRPEYIELPKPINAPLKMLPQIKFSDKELLTIENEVFGFTANSQLINADAIIMEESFFTDGNMIDNYDYKLFAAIKKRYPTKSILLKLHPRTIQNRFADDFEILDAPGIPWELIVFNQGNSSNKDLLLISINCASIVSDLFMFGKEGKKLILAPIFLDKITLQNGHHRFTQYDIDNLYKVRELYNRKENYVIANSEEEMYESLEVLLP